MSIEPDEDAGMATAVPQPERRHAGRIKLLPVLALLALITLTASLTSGCASRSGSRSAAPPRDAERAWKLNRRAAELLEAGEWARAEAMLDQAIAADVTYGPAHNNLGKAYFHRGDLYRAAWQFRYASRLMPYAPEPRGNLGLVFEAAGQFDEAVEAHTAATALRPDDPMLLGNEIRARVRRGDSPGVLRPLLTKLVLVERRPNWLAWAREELATLGADNGESERRATRERSR